MLLTVVIMMVTTTKGWSWWGLQSSTNRLLIHNKTNKMDDEIFPPFFLGTTTLPPFIIPSLLRIPCKNRPQQCWVDTWNYLFLLHLLTLKGWRIPHLLVCTSLCYCKMSSFVGAMASTGRLLSRTCILWQSLMVHSSIPIMEIRSRFTLEFPSNKHLAVLLEYIYVAMVEFDDSIDLLL
jgi:hypothetical protein